MVTAPIDSDLGSTFDAAADALASGVSQATGAAQDRAAAAADMTEDARARMSSAAGEGSAVARIRSRH